MSNEIATVNVNNGSTLGNRSFNLDGDYIAAIDADHISGNFIVAKPIKNGGTITLYPQNPNVPERSVLGEIKDITQFTGYGEMEYPLDVKLDFVRRSAWVADTGNDRVLRVSLNNFGVSLNIENITIPHALAVNPNDGSIFIKAYSSVSRGVVYHYDNLGNQLSEFYFDYTFPSGTLDLTLTSDFAKTMPHSSSIIFDHVKDRCWWTAENKIFMVDIKNKELISQEVVGYQNGAGIDVDFSTGRAFAVFQTDSDDWEILQTDNDNNEILAAAYIPDDQDLIGNPGDGETGCNDGLYFVNLDDWNNSFDGYWNMVPADQTNFWPDTATYPFGVGSITPTSLAVMSENSLHSKNPLVLSDSSPNTFFISGGSLFPKSETGTTYSLFINTPGSSYFGEIQGNWTNPSRSFAISFWALLFDEAGLPLERPIIDQPNAFNISYGPLGSGVYSVNANIWQTDNTLISLSHRDDDFGFCDSLKPSPATETLGANRVFFHNDTSKGSNITLIASEDTGIIKLYVNGHAGSSGNYASYDGTIRGGSALMKIFKSSSLSSPGWRSIDELSFWGGAAGFNDVFGGLIPLSFQDENEMDSFAWTIYNNGVGKVFNGSNWVDSL
tara:strand:- start:20933 stop:22765 length:1833 start_codon:yes stop_codon:yes gene_type:complete